jgi:hypothetical protein
LLSFDFRIKWYQSRLTFAGTVNMGKILKRDRLQELEEINQAMQQENVELRRLVQIIEEDRERM